jgi:hypothetical protein
VRRATVDPLAPLAGADGTASRVSIGEPELRCEGLDLALIWPSGIRFSLASIRDGRDGVRGELTVTLNGRRLSWGSIALSSTQTREALRKKLEHVDPMQPCIDYLEEMAYRLTQAARQGEPPVDVASYPTPGGPVCVMPGLMYRGDPTELHADADSLKSMMGDALLVSIATGASLPYGLEPAITGPVDYYDWETNEAVHVDRMRRIARGLGVDLQPGAITYRRMKRPLADVAGHLAADAHRRGVIAAAFDSMVFALAGGEGGFHGTHHVVLQRASAVRPSGRARDQSRHEQRRARRRRRPPLRRHVRLCRAAARLGRRRGRTTASPAARSSRRTRRGCGGSGRRRRSSCWSRCRRHSGRSPSWRR